MIEGQLDELGIDATLNEKARASGDKHVVTKAIVNDSTLR